MAHQLGKIGVFVEELLKNQPLKKFLQQLMPDPKTPSEKFPVGTTTEDMQRRCEQIGIGFNSPQSPICPPEAVENKELFKANIENYIGVCTVPMGIAGPLRVNGLFAQGDFCVPMATTEAALVASYNRGARLITAAGGATTMVLSEGVSRAPGFCFENLREIGSFITWLTSQYEKLKQITEQSSHYCKLTDCRIQVEGNHLYVILEFYTADAAGQNMVTFATDRICAHIMENTPVKPQSWYVEANLSGDKKATGISFQNVRGKKVSAEVVIPHELLQRYLHVNCRQICKYWQISAIGGALSGSFGLQGHYANGLAAMYLATGQDVACVAESAMGITRLETTPENDLYAAVTLPNLIVGTVGGGTKLPAQSQALKVLTCHGSGSSRRFAEVVAATCLAGELSIMGALTAGHFASAHENLARKR